MPGGCGPAPSASTQASTDDAATSETVAGTSTSAEAPQYYSSDIPEPGKIAIGWLITRSPRPGCTMVFLPKDTPAPVNAVPCDLPVARWARPPRAHQVTYHGVLAPAAAWRSAIVPGPSTSRRQRSCVDGVAGAAPRRRYAWAEMLARVFAVDVLRCGLCGGRRRLIAQITQPEVVEAMLSSLGLPTEVPLVHPARGPPELF